MTDMTNANFPTDSEGRTYHLYLKPGEAAQRVITVGDVPRAMQFAQLPGFEIKFVRCAPRLFTTITGLYKQTPVTIVTSLMGIPNMDFTIRELRYVINGPMAVIRVGTCGSPANVQVGDISVPSKFHMCIRDPDYFGSCKNASLEQMYRISHPIFCNQELHSLLKSNLTKNSTSKIHDGHNVTCCSFYSSQGRTDPNFRDKNENLIDHLVSKIPQLVSIEMESGHLVDMAENCTQVINAAAAHIIVAQRRSQEFLSNEKKHDLEAQLGVAALETLVSFKLEEMEQNQAVWLNEKSSGDLIEIQKYLNQIK